MKRQDEIKQYAERLCAAFRPEREYCRACGYAMPRVNGTGLCADCVPSWVGPTDTWLKKRMAQFVGS